MQSLTKLARLLVLVGLGTTGCTADVVELFPDAGVDDRPLDAGLEAPDAAPPDAESADAGMVRADTGAEPWDAGRTPVLRCPTSLEGDLWANGALVREDLGIKVSAAPNWTTYVTGDATDRSNLRYVHRHTPNGREAFDRYNIQFGDITTPPHLASFGDDRTALLTYSSGRSPTIISGLLAADRRQDQDSIGPIRFTTPMDILDVVVDGEDLVLAVGNAEGEAWLLKRTLAGQPTGWRQLDLTPGPGRIRKLRLVQRGGGIWVPHQATDGTMFEMIVKDGRLEEIGFNIACRNAELLDAAAIDADRFLYARTCSGFPPELKLHSIRTSISSNLMGLFARAAVAQGNRI